MKEYLLFDLDGTLTDPKIGITTCVQYALKEFGIEEPDLDKLEPFIGPPLKNSFMEYYHFTEEQAQQAVEKYRERFSEIGLFENEVYEGIPQMLRILQSRGMFLAIASSKPTVYIERILEHFDLRKYFKVVVGSELDGARVNKDEIIKEALNQLFAYKPINYAKVYMIGDRKYDIEGARKAGVESVGVTYGYGSPEELKKARADYIVRSVEELRTLLMREADALKESRETGRQGGPQQPQKSFIQIIWPFIFPFLIFIVGKNLAANALAILLQPIGTSIKGKFAELIFIYDDTGVLTALTGNASSVITALAFIIAASFFYQSAKNMIRKTKEEQRLNYIKKDSVKSYLLMIVIALFGMLSINILSDLAKMTNKAESYRVFATDSYSADLLFGILCMGIVIPIVEELLFRGILFNLLRKTYKLQSAMLVSAALYGFYQMDSVQGIYGFVIGCMATYAYVYYGSFLAPILVHVGASTLTYLVSYTELVDTALYSWPVCAVCVVITMTAIQMLMKEKKIL